MCCAVNVTSITALYWLPLSIWLRRRFLPLPRSTSSLYLYSRDKVPHGSKSQAKIVGITELHITGSTWAWGEIYFDRWQVGDPYYRFPLFYTKEKPGEVGKIMNKRRIAGFDVVEPEATKRESYLIPRLYPIPTFYMRELSTGQKHWGWAKDSNGTLDSKHS